MSGPAVGPEHAAEVIRAVVGSLSEDKIAEVLVQLQAYIQAMPDQARYLLLQNPQLAYAIVQCQQRAGFMTKEKAEVCDWKHQS